MAATPPPTIRVELYGPGEDASSSARDDSGPEKPRGKSRAAAADDDAGGDDARVWARRAALAKRGCRVLERALADERRRSARLADALEARTSALARLERAVAAKAAAVAAMEADLAAWAARAAAAERAADAARRDASDEDKLARFRADALIAETAREAAFDGTNAAALVHRLLAALDAATRAIARLERDRDADW